MRQDKALIFLFIFGLLYGTIAGLEEDCVDFFGNIITHGHLYVPGPSVCSKCVCYHSQSLWCKAIYCDPPYFCKKFRIGERCCEFDCLDSPEEIIREKERLRKRKRFLGISYGSGVKLIPKTSTTFILTLSLMVGFSSTNAMNIIFNYSLNRM